MTLFFVDMAGLLIFYWLGHRHGKIDGRSDLAEELRPQFAEIRKDVVRLQKLNDSDPVVPTPARTLPEL